MLDDSVHYIGPAGGLHAMRDPLSAPLTENRDEVTCPTCREILDHDATPRENRPTMTPRPNRPEETLS